MPFDVIKSRIQMKQDLNTTIYNEYTIILKEHGLKGFYKGLTAVVVRGFLVSSVTFCFYAQALDFLNKRNVD